MAELPLTPTLSPEYRGEGAVLRFTPDHRGAVLPASQDRRSDIDAWYRAWTATMKPASGSRIPQRERGYDAPWSEADGGFAAWRIGALVCTVVSPSSWDPAPWPEPVGAAAGRGLAGAGGILEWLPDLLIVRQSPEVHDEICRLLKILAEPEGFPLPWELDFGRELPPQCDLVRLTRQTADPVRRAYGLTLLATLRHPPDGVAELLGDRLALEQTVEDRDELRPIGVLLMRLLSSDAPEAAQLQQVVKSHVSRRRRALRALVTAGSAAGPAIARLLGTTGTDFTALIGSLRDVGTGPEQAVPYLLSTLATRPSPGLIEIIDALDPTHRATRKILDKWPRHYLPQEQMKQLEALLHTPEGSDATTEEHP